MMKSDLRCGRHWRAEGERIMPGPSILPQCKPADTDSIRRISPTVGEALRSPGKSLDASVRAFMEPRFGHDFSRVQVHTDTRAAESARAVHALAYTVGTDVVFRAGQYAPATAEGQRLIAHELTHVIQQSSLTGRAQTGAITPIGNDLQEREANTVAAHITDGLNTDVQATTDLAPTLQMAEEPGQAGKDQEDTCAKFENDPESFSIEAAKHFLTEVDPGASQLAKNVDCEVSPPDPQRMECDVTFSDGQKIHVTWIKNLNNVEAQRQTPDGRQWCVYHYVCDTPGSARYEKKGCSSNVNPRPSSPSGPNLVGIGSTGPVKRNREMA